MRIDAYEYGRVVYADCLNEVNGLSTLEDKSFDLCLTDPPFNVNYGKGTIILRGKRKTWDKYKTYQNKNNSYLKWCKSWFQELERICNLVIIYCGYQNLNMWIADIKKPLGIIWNFISNNKSGSSVAYLSRLAPFLVYGKLKKRFNTDVFKYISKWGFLREMNLKHPCPINEDLWEDIIIQANPTNVLDCFMGSGTTAEVCTKLGIKWLGYELNEVYSQDIDKRLRNCKKELQQVSLLGF